MKISCITGEESSGKTFHLNKMADGRSVYNGSGLYFSEPSLVPEWLLGKVKGTLSRSQMALVYLFSFLKKELSNYDNAFVDDIHRDLGYKQQQGLLKAIRETFPSLRELVFTTNSPVILNQLHDRDILFLEWEDGKDLPSVYGMGESLGWGYAHILGQLGVKCETAQLLSEFYRAYALVNPKEEGFEKRLADLEDLVKRIPQGTPSRLKAELCLKRVQ